jgi:hypothetical protein
MVSTMLFAGQGAQVDGYLNFKMGLDRQGWAGLAQLTCEKILPNVSCELQQTVCGLARRDKTADGDLPEKARVLG